MFAAILRAAPAESRDAWLAGCMTGIAMCTTRAREEREAALQEQHGLADEQDRLMEQLMAILRSQVKHGRPECAPLWMAQTFLYKYALSQICRTIYAGYPPPDNLGLPLRRGSSLIMFTLGEYVLRFRGQRTATYGCVMGEKVCKYRNGIAGSRLVLGGTSSRCILGSWVMGGVCMQGSRGEWAKSLVFSTGNVDVWTSVAAHIFLRGHSFLILLFIVL